MYCLSINYKKADVSVRGRFSFDTEKRDVLRRKVGHAVVLCTCNRTELYFTGMTAEDAAGLLADISGEDSVPEYLRTYESAGAVRHLFRVACGIDSMLIGEDEILRQVKEAYSEAAEAGSTDFELNTVFQAAVTCAKRIKTETALSKTPASSATIAANAAAGLGEKVKVLMIGASGAIGSATLKNLLSHRNVSVTSTARSYTPGHHPLLDSVRTVPYETRYEYMDEADCIISATSSPHFTITAKRFSDAVKTGKPRLLIDLAVPSDIERSVNKVAGVTLMNIDDLGELAKKGNELKLSAAEHAESIITEELDELLKKLAFHDFLPRMEKARKTAESLSFDELVYRLRDGLDSSQFSAVLTVLGSMEGK